MAQHHVRQSAEWSGHLAARDFGHRLAEFCRLSGELGVVGEDDVHRTLDRLLEVLATDLERASRRDAVRNDDDLGLRSVRLEPGEDPDRVARSGESQFGYDDRDMRV